MIVYFFACSEYSLTSAKGSHVTMKDKLKQILFICRIMIPLIVGILGLIFTNQIMEIIGNVYILIENDKFIGHYKQGEQIIHKFFMYNLRNRPLVIDYIDPNCVCSSASIDKFIIPPYKKATITLTVDTTKLHTGKLKKGLYIYLNNKNQERYLYVTFVLNNSTSQTPFKK